MVNKKTKANRIFTESEVEVFYLMGRFQRLVKPERGDLYQEIDYGKARFTELQSLALESLHDKLMQEVESMSSYIADLEISAGVAIYAGDKVQ